ncbi:MAG: glycosyltransferase family 4 protein [Gemmatimonadetes bacterium]|nr:glycosyltransferase family 4 protein [Gemmatimonadota bacterium]
MALEARAPGSSRLRRVALVGNHLPRRCGIATFTSDLGAAIAAAFPALDEFVVAMNDGGQRHPYPGVVRAEIDEADAASYRRAAEFLNVTGVDVVSLQHEYGIFGGAAGSLVLELLRGLEMPVVTTLHTLLADPDAAQRAVMDEIVQRSERLVVMSAHAAATLMRVHGVPADRVDLIPHGIPEVMFAPSDIAELDVAGREVLLTFGLLSPDKGIEHVIDALPAILAVHPHTVYIVLGATHPHVKAHAGESYRAMLADRARRLGVADSVRFHDAFVTEPQLAAFLAAADVYVTPYLNLEQSTSGTLAFAVGAGTAVISTPYRYACEVLAEGRGLLVPPRDAAAIADAAIGLLDDPARRGAMSARAAAFGRTMGWPQVAEQHVASMTRAEESWRRRRATPAAPAQNGRHAPAAPPARDRLPAINLAHLRAMTDDTGILQHAAYLVPRYADGYCVDDNARALALVVRLDEDGAVHPRVARTQVSRYLAFVAHALDAETGRFRNFLSYARQWMEPCGSDDSHGRSLWALGTVVARARDAGHRRHAVDLFRAALPSLQLLTSPRAWAYALLGLDEYLRTFPGDEGACATRARFADRLMHLHDRVADQAWPWFEEHLSYANARLPQALIVSGAAMGRDAMRAAGLRALGWLAAQQRAPDGTFQPVGSDERFARGGHAAPFDQQPIEAAGMVSACRDAYRITGTLAWKRDARAAFDWFVGRNHLAMPVFDVATGGCRDGLHGDRANENQGAESTISYLAALHDMHAIERAALG